MPIEDRGFAEALERVRAAVAAMGSGDPQPYIDCRARSEDVTLFGAWGPIERGRRQLEETSRRVGSRFKRGELVAEHTVAYASGDLGYTVGLERGAVAVDDGHKRPMTIHVTRTYRRIDDAWRLVHRHAEFPPGGPAIVPALTASCRTASGAPPRDSLDGGYDHAHPNDALATVAGPCDPCCAARPHRQRRPRRGCAGR